MRNRLGAVSFITAVALGCGGKSSAKPDAPVADAAPDAPPFTFQNTVKDWQTSEPITGALVCVPGRTDVACATSDTTGTFTLAVPQPASFPETLPLAATAPGYIGAVTLAYFNSKGFFIAPALALMATGFAATELGSDAGFTVPSTTSGYLQVRVILPNAAGTTAKVPSGTVVYGNGSGDPDKTLTAAGSDGYVWFGNVLPGVVELTFTGSGGAACTASPGGGLYAGDWPPAGSGTLDAQVVAGALTEFLNVQCQ